MAVTFAIEAHDVIVDLPYRQASPTRQDNLNSVCPTSTIATVHYRPTKDLEVRLTGHKIEESKDFQRLALDWQHKVDISKVYSEYCSKFIDILTQLGSIWDGHTGQTSIGKDKIDLLPNSNSVRSASYRAGITVQELHRLKIDKLFSQNVSQPAQTEWAAPTVIALEKDGALLFCKDN